MSYSSTGTSFSHNNWLEGEGVDSRPTGCVCNLQKKEKEKRERERLVCICTPKKGRIEAHKVGIGNV
jgi:hypothetical protein